MASAGVVYAVPSGDTVVLMSRTTQGQKPSFKTLTLSSITAPRFSSKGGSEPYGFLSREFLRNLLIGTVVSFTIDNKTSSGREYGDLATVDYPSIAVHIVKSGWAKVREGLKESSEKHQLLLEAQASAQSSKLGLWKEKLALEDETVLSDPTPDKQLLTKILHKQHKCLVDFSITGSFIRVILIDQRPMLSLTISLAGIQCPGWRKSENSDEKIAEPFAEQAKFNFEVRLLHRESVIELHSYDDKRNNFIGSLRSEQGDIQMFLVRNGYARLVEHQLMFTPTTAPLLREAQSEAQRANLGIWTGWVVPREIEFSKSQQGKLVEVYSGDCLGILTGDVVTRVFLVSIRAPRMATRTRRPDPLSFESREFLRKRFIGQNVHVTVKYSQEDRTYADVTVGNESIALGLVSEGLASVTRGKLASENPRSKYIDALMAAENSAKNSKKGIWMPEENQPKFLYQDLTLPPPDKSSKTDAVSAPSDPKTVLPMLKRCGRVPGIVEKIFTGSRFKILVPRASALLSLNLAGLIPLSREPEDINVKATRLATETILMRDVEIEVLSVDQRGSFIGNLYINNVNFVFPLLKQGLARLSTSPQDLDHQLLKQYEAAQMEASSAQLNIWAPGVLPEQIDNRDHDAEVGQSFSLHLGYIESSTRFCASKEQPDEAFMLSVVTAVMETNPPDRTFMLKKGAIVLGQSLDNQVWYRGRVLFTTPSEVKVEFIDTGFWEQLPLNRIRNCPDSLLPSKVAPLSAVYELAYCSSAPKSEPEIQEDGLSLFERFSDESHGTVTAKVMSIDKGIPQVFVTNSLGNSINLDLAFEGLIIPDRKGDASQEYVSFKQALDDAISNHRGLFRYGEPDFE
ncbi:hypothetical protein RCL1_001472 [Eukaryota sp. TZLM3-RCL]